MTPQLKSSFIILTRLKNELRYAQIGIAYIKDHKIGAYNSHETIEVIHKIDTAMYSLIYFSFIRYVAFLDEYRQFFKSSNTTEQNAVNLVKRKCEKYLQDVTDTFGEVKFARNKVLAHGYRNGRKTLSNSEINAFFNQLLATDGLEPYMKLSECTENVVQQIGQQFGPLTEDEISLNVEE